MPFEFAPCFDTYPHRSVSHLYRSDLAQWLVLSNEFFTWLFAAEALIKMIAFGFVMGARRTASLLPYRVSCIVYTAWSICYAALPMYHFISSHCLLLTLTRLTGEHAYLKSSWNRLDFALVIVSLVYLLAAHSAELKAFRTLRVLRPLRLLSRNEGMKLVITSLVKSMPAVGNVFGVVLACQLVFAVLGMQLFMGRMGSCTDPALKTKSECLGGESAARGGRDRPQWLNPAFGSFDDFGQAMMILYVASTGDNWPEFMYHTMDATAVDTAPERNDFSIVALFFILWMCVARHYGHPRHRLPP